MTTYTEIQLAKRPNNSRDIGPHLFETHSIEAQIPQEGTFSVKVSHLSLDPAMLGWMMPDEESYIPPVPLNTRMRGLGIGTVIDSSHNDYQAGDTVMGMFGWTEFAISGGEGVTKLDPKINREMALSVFALPGLTATQGLFNIGKPKAGETLLVTGAAGSVGSIVGQLAKAEGLRVIGVVGSEEKAQWVVEKLGFDGAINYKSDNALQQLKELTPDGIDIFFENTGGDLQSPIVDQMNVHGRIVVCGMIADYQMDTPRPGPNWIPLIKKRITITGFAMPDHFSEIPQLLEKLTPYVLQGKIQYRAHVLKGLESTKSGLDMFFSGKNLGKLMVEI